MGQIFLTPAAAEVLPRTEPIGEQREVCFRDFCLFSCRGQCTWKQGQAGAWKFMGELVFSPELEMHRVGPAGWKFAGSYAAGVGKNCFFEKS